jgi:hypothetical protein
MQLQLMFALLSKGFLVQPAAVCTAYRMNGAALCPHTQEDAAEFFEALLDGLPAAVAEPFAGQTAVDFSGVGTTFATTVMEPFRLLSLPLELSVVAAVASFCAGQLLKHQTPDGQIDAISASRIVAPPTSS